MENKGRLVGAALGSLLAMGVGSAGLAPGADTDASTATALQL